MEDLGLDYQTMLAKRHILGDTLLLTIDFRFVDDGELPRATIPDDTIHGEAQFRNPGESARPVLSKCAFASHGGNTGNSEGSGTAKGHMFVEMCEDAFDGKVVPCLGPVMRKLLGILARQLTAPRVRPTRTSSATADDSELQPSSSSFSQSGQYVMTLGTRMSFERQMV
jgi:hypothetical protein